MSGDVEQNGLPKGWVRTCLSAITEDTVEQTGPSGSPEFMYVDISSIDNTKKRIVAPKTLARNAAPSRARQNLKSGDVVVSMTRPNLNAVALVPPELDGSIGSTGFHVLRSTTAESGWLYYAVQTNDFVQAMFRLVQGALYPAVRPKDIRGYGVSLPPAPEQRRIVAKIEELFSDLDAGVAALERVKANLKRYRAAVLKAAVEGRLTAEWRRQHPPSESADRLLARILHERRQKWEADQLRKHGEAGRTPPKGWRSRYEQPMMPTSSDHERLPNDWVWATIDQLCHFVTSGSRGWAEHYSDSGPVFIRAQDINSDILALDGVAHVNPPRTAEAARTRCQRFDVLVTVTGANVAKTAWVKDRLGEAFVSQHVGLVRPVLPEMAPFLHAWIVCPSAGRADLLRWAYGAGKPGLSLEQVRSLRVAVPPLDEQRQVLIEIEQRLSVAEATEAEVELGVRRASRLRQAILKCAFGGRLRH